MPPVDEDLDYTKEDDSTSGVPFKSPDDYLDDLYGYLPPEAPSATAIESTSFQPLEAGKHRVKVVKIEAMHVDDNGIPKKESFDVLVAGKDGKPKKRLYYAYRLRVNLADVNRPNYQVSDFFKMLAPNPTEDERHAYVFGVGKDKPERINDGRSQGFEMKKLVQFLSRLGFERSGEGGDEGDFNPEAYRPGNWKDREIIVETVMRDPAQKLDPKTKEPMFDGEGKPIYYPPSSGVKMFGYHKIDDAPVEQPAAEAVEQAPEKPANDRKKKK